LNLVFLSDSSVLKLVKAPPTVPAALDTFAWLDLLLLRLHLALLVNFAIFCLQSQHSRFLFKSFWF
jgi:hypothetical protein